MAEKELNLFEFSSGSVAEAYTAAEKIMRREMIDADSLGISFDRVPDEVGGHSKIQLGSAFADSPEDLVRDHAGIPKPDIDQSFTPVERAPLPAVRPSCSIQRNGIQRPLPYRCLSQVVAAATPVRFENSRPKSKHMEDLTNLIHARMLSIYSPHLPIWVANGSCMRGLFAPSIYPAVLTRRNLAAI
jgi:hypothetical protein